MRDCQLERHTTETGEERDVQLEADSERHRQRRLIHAGIPILDQPAVQVKFHTALATLEVSRCASCLELNKLFC